ncbi:MAG: hypothetical protein CVU03_03455 [Bacteroidetes bacterium HGW-Bacteroidetes-2]|jgi:hypothetical protein|nr:MAG: hypothetical protein CVU03_03455 [Bacteroidetes bacterium HGW-Bacteroidetes-2]
MTEPEIIARLDYLFEALRQDKLNPVQRLDWIDRLHINQERADLFRAQRAAADGQDYTPYRISGQTEQKITRIMNPLF